MFSKTITNSARFLKMPQEAQNLYFHLCMNADDDGVVEAFTIMQMLGTSQDIILNLVGRNFVKVLNEDIVSYILDWQEQNFIRADRKIDSVYKSLLLQVIPDIQLLVPQPRSDVDDNSKRVGGQSTDGLGKVRLGKVSVGKERLEKTLCPKMDEADFTAFWNTYPRHDTKAISKIKFLKLEKSLLPRILSAVQAQSKSEQWQKDNGQFIPQPLTWINQKRWEDEIKEGKPSSFEQIAKQMIKEIGDNEIAFNRFVTKYGMSEASKLLNIFNIF